MTKEELDEEERIKEEARLLAEENRLKLTDLNEIKSYTIDATL